MGVNGKQDLVDGCHDLVVLRPTVVVQHFPVSDIHLGSAPKHGGHSQGYLLDDFSGWPNAGGEVCYTCEFGQWVARGWSFLQGCRPRGLHDQVV